MYLANGDLPKRSWRLRYLLSMNPMLAISLLSLFPCSLIHQVDKTTRNKMEEMLLTWRTGSSAGKKLFGVLPQIAIGRCIWGDGAANYNVSVSRLIFVSFEVTHYLQSLFLCGRVTEAQVLSELEYPLGQKEHALQTNPYDTTSQNHINLLHQVCALSIAFRYNNHHPDICESQSRLAFPKRNFNKS
jgi:hypothetical protein